MATNEEIMKKLEQISSKLDALEITLDEVETKVRDISRQPTYSPTAYEEGASIETNDAQLRKMKAELDLTKKVVENSYTKEEVADYFGAIVNDFNTKTKTDAGDVDYVISTMDVDLKAQIYKENELKMSGANVAQAGESGISSVKISIKAVPKQIK